MPVMLRVSRHASMVQIPLAETDADRGNKTIVLTPTGLQLANRVVLAVARTLLHIPPSALLRYVTLECGIVRLKHLGDIVLERGCQLIARCWRRRHKWPIRLLRRVVLRPLWTRLKPGILNVGSIRRHIQHSESDRIHIVHPECGHPIRGRQARHNV
jgi:hypothetical protein